MNKFLYVVLAVVMLAIPAFAKKDKLKELREDRIYIMYLTSCPMCQKAMKHIDEKYAGSLYIIKADLATIEGRAMLYQCRQKHGIKDVILPMICAGNEYTMGWSTPIKEKFDEYMANLSY